MPKSLSRIFIAALLALAIPLQGIAAVAAAQCMAMGHHQDAGGLDHAHQWIFGGC